jgi:hypothetical protein
VQEFTCAKVGDAEWAAARVSPGDTVFFLQWNGTKWNAEDSQSICGTASAGLPQSLLSYCKAAPSSSSTTPATAACTSEAILAALPGGATMQEFTCADVGGKLWAAGSTARIASDVQAAVAGVVGDVDVGDEDGAALQ